jgi:hypothetical protein
MNLRVTCTTLNGGYEIDPCCSNGDALESDSDLLIMAEARMILYRLHVPKQPTDFKSEAGMLSIWKNEIDPILDLRSDHPIPVY